MSKGDVSTQMLITRRFILIKNITNSNIRKIQSYCNKVIKKADRIVYDPNVKTYGHNYKHDTDETELLEKI